MNSRSPSTRENSKEKQKRQYCWWLYHIRKALRARQNGYCPDCHQEKKTRLYRLKKTNDLPAVNDYLLLCSECITKKRADKEKQRQEERNRRREEQKKTTEWIRKRKNRDKPSKEAIWARIRFLIFQRDGYKCVFCDTKEELGLTSLIAESKGGSVQFDNYVTCCQFCRCSKGNKFPLNFIWDQISFKYWLTEQLYHEPTASPGVTQRVNLHLISEISQFLMRIATNEDIEGKIRNQSERLNIKLSETDEDRHRERAEVGSWIQ